MLLFSKLAKDGIEAVAIGPPGSKKKNAHKYEKIEKNLKINNRNILASFLKMKLNSKIK